RHRGARHPATGAACLPRLFHTRESFAKTRTSRCGLFTRNRLMTRHDPSRSPRAPRGNTLNCKSWQTEAPFRMLQNNLDAEVAEDPTSLVVYGGIGRAARDWESYDRILETLKRLDDNQTL